MASMNEYLTWAAFAVLGLLREADEILRRDGETVRRVAKEMARLAPVSPRPLWRGVLLPEHVDSTVLVPQRETGFSSFSEEKSVAQWFSSPTSIISELVIQMDPGTRGFLANYLPTEEDYRANLLFHWHWGRSLPTLPQASLPDLLSRTPFPRHYIEQIAWSLETQEEVILRSHLPLALVANRLSPTKVRELDQRFAMPHLLRHG